MTAIEVRRLRKRYEIGALRDASRSDSLRESVATAAAAQWRRIRRGAWRRHPEYVWALDDVSFTVPAGQVIGIIGRNGAGKSTLLKVLSRITRPTDGYAEIHGRLGSLLEVGTGFHPDLTGRDNIFLNGAILGMRRDEIRQRFDDIVDFSGIARFLDTPVKRYSSGMYVRLAFAVAAHLEADVLLVDEVLAVGDAEFQKKCIGKMQDVVRHGRTVLFVSHNMAAVKSLCDRALLLDRGRVLADGGVDDVIARYLGVGAEQGSGSEIPADASRSGSGEARFRRVDLLTTAGEPVAELYFQQRFRIRMTLDVAQAIGPVVAGVIVQAIDGTTVASAFSTDGGRAPFRLAEGLQVLEADIDLPLLPRTYTVTLALHRTDGYDIDVVGPTVSFSVLNAAETGTDAYPWGTSHGYVRASAAWRAPQPVDGVEVM